MLGAVAINASARRGAHFSRIEALAFFSFAALCALAVFSGVILSFRVRCPKCHARLGMTWKARTAKFCPFCGADLDEPMAAVVAQTSPPV
jgi:hypothetical protein